MKNIEEYIIEQEFDDNFLIEEGFFSWIAKLGKKFWAWLTGKDYTGDDVDWNVGKKKKLQWVATKSSEFEKITKNKGLADNFPSTMRIIEKTPNLGMMQAVNSSRTPVIMILLTNNKEMITKILQKNAKNYDRYMNRVANVENPIMILSIEIARGNNEDEDDIFDDYIRKEIDNNLMKSYDVVFIDQRRVHNSFQKLLQYEYDFEKDFPVFSAATSWDDIDNKTPVKKPSAQDRTSTDKKPDEEKPQEQKPTEEKPQEQKPNDKPKTKKQAKKKEPKEEIPKADNGDIEIEKKRPKPKEKTVPDNIIEFSDTSNDEVIATAEYTNDPKRIAKITNIKVDEKDFYNFAITKLDINDKYTVAQYENVIDDFILPVICNKLAEVTKIGDDKELKIYIKLDDATYADHIKKLRKLSLVNKIKMKESINNIFIIIGRKSSDMIATTKELKNKQKAANNEETKPTNESLDVDNLFWMLDTWFANNEQEKTSFISLVDNCIIKKTYNKNDLAKLCDNINFDIRPFINFISKDAVIKDNEREDVNIDYYYELKKIIDALISNKATNNKYVRFS